jgi:hypothetical protein
LALTSAGSGSGSSLLKGSAPSAWLLALGATARVDLSAADVASRRYSAVSGRDGRFLLFREEELECSPEAPADDDDSPADPAEHCAVSLAGSCRKAKILANMIVLPVLQAVSVLDFPK